MAAGESILSVVATVLTIVCTYDLRGQVGCMIGGMRAFNVSPVKHSYAFIKFFFAQLFFSKPVSSRCALHVGCCY